MSDHSTTIEDLARRIDALLSRDTPWPRWLSVDLAAKYSSISPASVRRLIAAGKLTPRRVVRGRLLIDRHEIDVAIGAATSAVRNGRGSHVANNGRRRGR